MTSSPSHISSLGVNEIFVFGSNRAGYHGKGAALQALRCFGAVKRQGEGLMGRSYGIPTKDENLRTLSLSEISVHVAKFLDCARSRPEMKFLVTKIGCGLAGYAPCNVAPLFFRHGPIPENVLLPESFLEIPRKPM